MLILYVVETKDHFWGRSPAPKADKGETHKYPAFKYFAFKLIRETCGRQWNMAVTGSFGQLRNHLHICAWTVIRTDKLVVAFSLLPHFGDLICTAPVRS